MFRTLLALLLVAAASPIAARAGELSEVPVFACGTGEDALEVMLQLRSGVTEDGTVATIQFIEQNPHSRLAPWPEDGFDARERMMFSNSHGPEGYVFVVRWSNHGLDYALYSHVKPDNEDGIAEGDAGLVVLDADGAVKRRVACAEPPSVYLDLLSEGTTCDEVNPIGAAACDVFNPPIRRAPLATYYPWLAAK